MKIGILGWGSLLWDRRDEFDRQRSRDWMPDGPTLSIEFSRISDTRSRALTLVIDDFAQTQVRVSWSESRRQTIHEAVTDLRQRERTPRRNIGVLDLSTPADRESPAVSEIRAWATSKGLNAVIWTALASNFKDRTRRHFRVDAALKYLRRLPPLGKARAFEYIARAPDFVRTPLREAVEREDWYLIMSQGSGAGVHAPPQSTSSSVKERLSDTTRRWLADIAFQASRTAGDSDHPCRELATNLLTEWVLWRWTADREVDNVAQPGHCKYDVEAHESTPAARVLAKTHRSKKRVPGLSHHHVVPRGTLAAKLILATSKEEVLAILERDGRARVLKKTEHDELHGKATTKATKR